MRDPAHMHKDALGLLGEKTAARFLEGRGLRVVARRVRTGRGEIDLVALEGGEVVFVEVKTRQGAAFGLPEEAVTAHKRRQLRAAAETYLAEREMHRRPFRIDVVAVRVDARGGVFVRHIPSAVGEED